MTKKNDLYIVKDINTGVITASGLTKTVAEQYVAELNTDFGMNVMAEMVTGAGAIAVNIGGGDKPVRRMPSLADYVLKKTPKKKKKDLVITLGEKFDMDNIFSRLAGMERNGQIKKKEGTTFGIEDDNGNLMKVTVRAEQAEEFEQEIARYIADIRTSIEDLPMKNSAKEISMAELLYKMRDKFDIIDVEFPKIPTDVIYNADKATPATDIPSTAPEGEMGDMGDDMNANMNFDELNPENGTGELDADIEGANGTEGELDLENPDDLDMATDFEEEPDDQRSILDKVISMLKSQADADIERARAEAEKAKAEQARYTAQATQFAMRDEEERLRYELEQEEQKKREKDARRMEDMAKHKIAKTLSMSESDEGMTPELIMRQRQEITKRFAITPTDSPETRQFKNIQKAEAMREWTSKYRQALNFKRYQTALRDQTARQPQQQQQQPQQNGANNEVQ